MEAGVPHSEVPIFALVVYSCNAALIRVAFGRVKGNIRKKKVFFDKCI